MLQGTLAFNQMRLGEVMRLAESALDQAAEGTRTHQQARLMHGRAAAMSGRKCSIAANQTEARTTNMPLFHV